MKKLSITVAIPTCYGGESLISTAKTIYASKGVGDFRFIIVADRTPVSPKIKKTLKEMGVELFWNPVEGSQPKKLKQMRDMTKSDLFVFTQDDIDFTPDALRIMTERFEKDPKLTALSVAILPHSDTKTWVEAGMASFIRIVFTIARLWNKGDNYLAASGRCMVFRMSHFNEYRIPEKMVNTDMFFYLENKRLNGKFAMAPDSEVYIRAPQTLKDQLGPSSRYQFQRAELTKFFDFDYSHEYTVPTIIALWAVIKEFIHHPLGVIQYAFVFAYTRIKKQPSKTVSNPVWAVDSTTKS